LNVSARKKLTVDNLIQRLPDTCRGLFSSITHRYQRNRSHTSRNPQDPSRLVLFKSPDPTGTQTKRTGSQVNILRSCRSILNAIQRLASRVVPTRGTILIRTHDNHNRSFLNKGLTQSRFGKRLLSFRIPHDYKLPRLNVPAEGAHRAASTSLQTSSSETSLAMKALMLLLPLIASRTSITAPPRTCRPHEEILVPKLNRYQHSNE